MRLLIVLALLLVPVYSLNGLRSIKSLLKSSRKHLSPSTVQDIEVAGGTAAAAYAWLQLWIKLSSEKTVSPVLSRKIIHW